MALQKLRAMGVRVETTSDTVTVEHQGALRPVDIQTLPHPGFPTDLQAQFMVLDALADGPSVITENVFENRFMFADEIARMGADIRIDGHYALINGVAQFSGAPVRSPDLRGGAALVLAGLAADGETLVSGLEHIDRGYERFVEKLKAIGACIERK
jgi:UDP-N-acetylglucosamine 1-carboxyvinyltransferase